MCQEFVYDYINKIEEIVEKGMEKGQIKKGNSKAIASEIYALIASTLVYKMKDGNELDVIKLKSNSYLYRNAKDFEGELL